MKGKTIEIEREKVEKWREGVLLLIACFGNSLGDKAKDVLRKWLEELNACLAESK